MNSGFNYIVSVSFAAAILIFMAIKYLEFFQKLKFKDAVKAFAEKKYIMAVSMFEDISEREPQNSLLYWYMARANIKNKSISRAIAELKKVLQINNYSVIEESPDIGNFSELGVQYLLRDIYEQSRMHDKLFTQLQILMKMEPDNAQHPMAIAKMLISKKEYSERTIKYLKQAMNISTQNLEVFNLIAYVYFKQNSYEKAKEYAEKALSLQPASNEAKYIMGEYFYKSNIPDTAEEYLIEAQNSELFGKSILFLLGKIYFQKGEWETSLNWLEQAVKMPKSFLEDEDLEWEAYYLSGLNYENLYDAKSAVETYEHIQKYKPDFKDIAHKLQNIIVEDNSDLIKDFITAKKDIFNMLSENILNYLGYEIENMYTAEDGSINLIALEKGISHRHAACFVKRNYDLISEDQIMMLVKYVQSSGASHGIFVTTGEFTGTAKNYAEKYKVKVINSSQLEGVLAKISKA
ncbi:MAG: restriction endonuclease [Spirochaetia bacterium]|nr:restriction endonuclease [Spirochaetia bacterium]